jgi:TPR repeat protein
VVGKQKNLAEAFRWYYKSAMAGNDSGMYNVGYFYTTDSIGPHNYNLAMEWFLKSAEKGNGRAMDDIGFIYKDGLGVKVSYSEALKWFRKSAETGFVPGICHVGTILVKRDSPY